MKISRVVVGVLLVIISCGKPDISVNTTPPVINDPHPPAIVDTPTISSDTFTNFYILQGKNYCENNSYVTFKENSIRFKAIFDSSCIYKNADPKNQADINKLYGFSDCRTLHHANSARFGWNWLDGEIHIHAYCYADSIRSYKELGIVKLNQEVECSIKVLSDSYVFTLNGKQEKMLRHCSDTIANGVKLLPYFGGDEPAPHNIRIRIREMK